MKYVLDTDVAIDLLKGDASTCERIQDVKEINITCVTAAELYYGAYKSQRPRVHEEILKAFLEGVYVLEMDLNACRIFGKIKSDLKSLGKSSGDFDTVIASICLSTDSVLITGNVKHFQAIKGLTVQSI